MVQNYIDKFAKEENKVQLGKTQGLGLCDIRERWTDVIRCGQHGHHHNNLDDADNVDVDNVDDIVPCGHRVSVKQDVIPRGLQCKLAR